MSPNPLRRSVLAAAAALLLPAAALANEAVIRKNLAERLPNFPKIDEISKTPIPGLYEVRIGNDRDGENASAVAANMVKKHVDDRAR